MEILETIDEPSVHIAASKALDLTPDKKKVTYSIGNYQ